MRGRPVAVASALIAGLALAGCYGSTEPATEIGPESARLNARGTTNNGPATSYFEYWLTGSSQVRRTPAVSWPGGISGPFWQRVSGLAASASYSFRMCGADSGATSYVCAQTRTFTTTRALEDSVEGSFFSLADPKVTWIVDAASGPSGDNPHGTFELAERSGLGTTVQFTGRVVCLHVDGREATIRALGERTTNPPDSTDTVTLLVSLVDGHLAADSVGPYVFESRLATDCSTEPFGQSPGGDFVVNDATP